MPTDYTKMIIDAIEAQPGLRRIALAKAVGLHHDSLANRVRTLVRRRKILVELVDKAQHYFPVRPEFARRVDRLLACHAAQDPRRKILIMAAQRPCLIRDFVAELGLSRSWVNMVVLRMAAGGLLAREADGRWTLAWNPGNEFPLRPSFPARTEPSTEGTGGVEADG